MNRLKENLKKNGFVYLMTIIALAPVIYYMLGPSEGYLHSDCVDTMTWAGATIDSGKLFSDTFNYPYLLPFGSTFFVYPFMLIFGFNLFAYRFAMIVFMLVLFAGILVVAKYMKWDKRLAVFAVAVEFMMLSSSQKMRELFWEHIIHYSLGAFLAIVLIALMFAFLHEFESNNFSFNKDGKLSKKTVILAVCMFLWSFFSAFDGLTTLTLSAIPVMGALLLTVLFDFKNNIFNKKNSGIFTAFVIIVFATAIGGLVLSIVASDISANYGGAYSNIVDRSEWSTNMLKFLDQWTSLLGADYEIGGAITKGKNIFAAIKLAGAFVLFLTPVAALFMLPKLNRNERIFTFYHWFMTAFILYGYVFGSLSSVNWRLSPIVFSAVIVNVIVWKIIWQKGTKRGAVLVASLVVASAVITLCQIFAMPADYGRDNDHHKAVELLESYGLDYGYATYWNANVLTLISNSNVEVRDVNLDEDEPRAGWLNSDKVWYDDQPDRDTYFFLLSNGEYNDMVARNHVILEDTREIIREGNWVVLVKDNNIF